MARDAVKRKIKSIQGGDVSSDVLNRFALGVPLFLLFLAAILFDGGKYVAFFFLVAILGMTMESFVLFWKLKPHEKRLSLFSVFVLSFATLINLEKNSLELNVPLYGFFSLGFCLLLFRLRRFPVNRLALRSIFVGMHHFWCLFPLASIGFFLREESGAGLLVLMLVTLVTVNDTFAYLGGKMFGKRKLVPSVSPGKTVEGSLSGLSFTLLAGLVFRSFADLRGEIWEWTTILIAVSFFAQLGDLAESKLKRLLGIKNSGKWLGAHGGFLDRGDSLVLSAPAFLTLLFLFGLAESANHLY